MASYIADDDDDDDPFERFAVKNDSDDESETLHPIGIQSDDPKPMCIGTRTSFILRCSSRSQADLGLVLVPSCPLAVLTGSVALVMLRLSWRYSYGRDR